MTVENDTIDYPDVLILDEGDEAIFVPFNEDAKDFLLSLDLLGIPDGEVLMAKQSRVSDVIWALWDFGLVTDQNDEKFPPESKIQGPPGA